MQRFPRYFALTAAAVLALAAASPAWAQQSTTVNGLVVNFGAVPAEVALSAAGHSQAHPAHPPAGSEHLLVTLDDQKTGQRIGDADVAIEVTEPHGHVQTKHLLHTQAGGFADYSELFTFGSSGKYSIRVIIVPPHSAKPIETEFVVHHVI